MCEASLHYKAAAREWAARRLRAALHGGCDLNYKPLRLPRAAAPTAAAAAARRDARHERADDGRRRAQRHAEDRQPPARGGAAATQSEADCARNGRGMLSASRKAPQPETQGARSRRWRHAHTTVRTHHSYSSAHAHTVAGLRVRPARYEHKHREQHVEQRRVERVAQQQHRQRAGQAKAWGRWKVGWKWSGRGRAGRMRVLRTATRAGSEVRRTACAARAHPQRRPTAPRRTRGAPAAARPRGPTHSRSSSRRTARTGRRR